MGNQNDHRTQKEWEGLVRALRDRNENLERENANARLALVILGKIKHLFPKVDKFEDLEGAIRKWLVDLNRLRDKVAKDV